MQNPPTPDNVSYLWLGLAALVIIYGVFVASLFVRRRSLQKDLDVIRRLEDDERRGS